jgi:hypothetical protein
MLHASTAPSNVPEDASSNYVRGVIKLMIWHVWDLHHKIGEPIEALLDHRVDIVRKTTLCDGNGPTHGWAAARHELAEMISGVGSSEETHPLEEQCLVFLWPFIRPKLALKAGELASMQIRPFYCWRAEPFRAKPGRIALHFANGYQPESPFRDRGADLITSLRELMRHLAHSESQSDRILCGSWLNQYPPFQQLFPSSWSGSFVPVYDFWNTSGWWGQYMTHRGDFNERNAALFRQRHRHPYMCGYSECRIDEVLEHLLALD